MRNLYLTLLLLLLTAVPHANLSAQINTPLLAASPFADSLWVIDTANGYSRINSLQVSSTNTSVTVAGMNGMAVHPCTGDIYVVVKPGTGPRRLGIIDPVTGVISDIGSMGDNFAGITILNDTTMYGVTGDGASTSESLFRINMNTGAATFLSALGNGSDGESILYNPDNNLIYHLSGLGTPNVDEIFESVNPSTFAITSITLSGFDMDEVFGTTYLGNGKILVSNIDAEFIILDTSGSAAFTGFSSPVPIAFRGLGFPLRYIATDSVTAICPGDSLELHATPGDSFQWVFNGNAIPNSNMQDIFVNQVGQYDCVIWVGSCADSSFQKITVTQANLPNVSISPSGDTYFCSGDSLQLTGSSGGSSQWYFNGSPIPGAITNQYTVSAIGIYNMTKTNQNGCTDSAAVGANVMEYIPGMLTVIPSDTMGVCAGASLILTASPSSFPSYQWYMNGGAIPGQTDDSLVVAQAGDYSVTATLSPSCSDSSAGYTLQVFLPPTAMYTQSADTVPLGTGVTFTDNSTDAAVYAWDFGDGNGSPVPSPTHTYGSTGTYTVTLTVTNGPCPPSTMTSNVVVIDSTVGLADGLLYGVQLAPNPFGKGTMVQFSLENDSEVELTILNALGQQVRVIKAGMLPSGTHRLAWDGTSVDGSQLGAGVYIFRLKVGDRVVTRKGLRMQ